MSGLARDQRRPFMPRDLVRSRADGDGPFVPVYRVRKWYRKRDEIEIVLIGLKPPNGPAVQLVMDDPPRPFCVDAACAVHVD